MARNEIARERGGSVPVRGAGTLGTLRGEMNRLFDRFYGGRSQDMVEGVRPQMDPFEAFPWPFGRMESALGQTDLSETGLRARGGSAGSQAGRRERGLFERHAHHHR